MAGVTISSVSTQNVLAAVRYFVQGQLANPTGFDVQMAFISGWSKPAEDNWVDADWAWTTSEAGYYAAQCLVGPAGGQDLAVGTYTIWVMITASPETVAAAAGTLTIT